MYIKILSFKSVRDKEHIEIIELYAGEMEFNELAQKLGTSTRTPYTHIHQHNDAVKRSGFCAFCRRVGGEFENKQVFKRKEVCLVDQRKHVF